MRKLILILPFVIAGFLITGSYYLDLQGKNQNLENQISKLQKRVAALEQIKPAVLGAATLEPTPKPTAKLSKNNILDTPAPSPTPAPNPSPTFVKVAKTKTSSGYSSSITIPTPTPTPALSPTPTPFEKVTVDIQNLGTYQVGISDNDTAFDVLLKAGQQNSFNIDSQYYDGMGYFVTCIGGTCGHDNFFWAFYYNGTSSMVGASLQKVSAGNTTGWKFESW